MRLATYKVIDLFGNEELRFFDTKNNIPSRRAELFNDYESFVNKFEPGRRTTDDCFTPPEVFNLILNYVRDKCAIDGKEIIRPFYPGGDFESIDYPPGCVVIDNPPFSIVSKIARFYISRNISFFLFAPHLTLFSGNLDCTYIVVGRDIVYDNNAAVKTSFLSNMFGDMQIIGDAELSEKIRQLGKIKDANLPTYVYPNHVTTVSEVTWIIERGISVSIRKSDVKFCRGLDSQKKYKKAIFGSGFLLSDRAAKDKEAAKRAAEDKSAVLAWELSGREMEIIKSLSNKTK